MTTSASDPYANGQVTALSQRVALNLSQQQGVQSIQDIQAEFGGAQTAIKAASARQAQVKTMAETTRAPEPRRLHAIDIARLEKRRVVRIAHLAALIARDGELNRRLDLLVSIKGVGERTALAFVIRLPELGSASREEIAALAGVAPYDHDSGKRHGRRYVEGGRKRLRKSLFMSAFAATSFNPDLRNHYRRLRQAGKPHLLAVIAVARKLVVLANTIVARGTPWTPQHP